MAVKTVHWHLKMKSYWNLSQRYLKEADVPSWTAEVSHPDDLEILARENFEDIKTLMAKLSYTTIALSRVPYQCAINSDTQQAFDRFYDSFALAQQAQREVIVQAKHELAQRPGLREIFYLNNPGLF